MDTTHRQPNLTRSANRHHRVPVAMRDAARSSANSAATIARTRVAKMAVQLHSHPHRAPLYTPQQRLRRDSTNWTLVQGVLAPFQFVVFLVSLVLVVRYLATGEGLWAANASIVIKTAVLYLIMVTGAIWEKIVFGQYLFAPAFYWEDVFSMLVIALHTAYLVALIGGGLTPTALMLGNFC